MIRLKNYSRLVLLRNKGAAGWAHAHLDQFQAAAERAQLSVSTLWSHMIRPDAKVRILPDALYVDLNATTLPFAVNRLSMMLDHPCFHLRTLQDKDPQRHMLTWVDEGHLDDYRTLGFPFPAQFLAHAGPQPEKNPRSMADRDIDILFSGTLSSELVIEELKQDNPGISDEILGAVFAAAQMIEREQCTPLSAIAAALPGGLDQLRNVSQELCFSIVGTAIVIASTNRRLRILTALSSLRLHICSNVLPAELANASNVTFHGYVNDWPKLNKLISRAKIVLNMNAKFPRGSHERIWAAMAQGACVLTDQSSYVARDFQDRHAILFLPPGDPTQEVVEEITNLVEAHGSLEAIASSAGDIYQRHHTWSRRIEEIL